MAIQVFISYKSEYRDFARAVKSELNQWGYDTWLDVDNIQPGDYFRHKIQQGLDSSDVLLMVLTEEAQLSREVMSEVDYFLDVAKKPVVPLRHRECKPLYIFVSIQYIDFVTNQDTGFVQLKHRLTELASSITQDLIVAPQTPGATTILDAIGGGIDLKPEEQATSGATGELAQAPEPVEKKRDEAELEKSAQRETEKKEILDDGLFDLAPLEPAIEIAAPKPQPVPASPPSMGQQAPLPSAPAQPATASYQPQRQPSLPSPQATAPLGRRRSSPVLWSLAAVATLVIVVGAVVLFSSNATISSAVPPQPSQGTSPLVWVAVVLVVGAAGFIGWRRFGRSSAIPDAQTDAANRATMLQNVEDFWLKGVLDPALEAGTLDIGLSSAPGAVLRHKDYGDYALPPNANILDVFNDLNRELLILGAPGGGKTVLLLQLARELINQARQDATKAFPVVFNLSSWTAERKPLAEWIVNELRQKYQVPKKVAIAWVEGEKLLFLLDGLDEVAEQYRNDCVDAINAFRQQYRTVDLALCSRNEEYDALTSKLDVRGAIVLEPLSQPIIDAYLDRPELANLRHVMTNDKELQEMSQVPFLLNAMAYAYAGATSTNLQFPASDDPAKARRTNLFDRWAEKRLAAKSNADYTSSKVQRWLTWLANNLINFQQTTFYIEDLQLGWLKDAKKSFTNKAIFRWAVGGTYSLVIGLIFGIVLGFFLEFSVGQFSVGFVLGLLIGVVVGLGLGLDNSHIHIVESLKWQLNIRGLIVSIIVGFAVAFLYSRFIGLIWGLAFGLVTALMILIASGLVGTENISGRIRPNQGIRSSAWNASRVGVLGALLIALVFGLFISVNLGIATGLTSALVTVFLGGPFLSLIVSLFGGGQAVVKHFILRIMLWLNSNTPWNYARFLDYCASAGLLRKVGGGYIFAHRYLMEYFAENYQEGQK